MIVLKIVLAVLYLSILIGLLDGNFSEGKK